MNGDQALEGARLVVMLLLTEAEREARMALEYLEVAVRQPHTHTWQIARAEDKLEAALKGVREARRRAKDVC